MKTFKYAGKWRAGYIFAEMSYEWMRNRQMNRDDFRPDLVVCVPTSDLSLLARGYNQTALIARQLARRLKIPFSLRALSSRSRIHQPQAALRTTPERAANVRQIFTANPRLVQGKRILLVDDVVTTGSTLSSAAEALVAAGGKAIFAHTICRSTAFSRYRLEQAYEKQKNLSPVAA